MTSRRTRARLVERLVRQGIRSEAVLKRMHDVPRHIFVDEALASRAYEDTALPIGHGQTISQPYIVARMTEALLDVIEPGDVLEIGSGCGYQSAVLAGLVKRVFSIERLNPILWGAKQRMKDLNIYNVVFRRGDGWLGWKKHAPYDGIIVTAAPPEVPGELLKQLRHGGRLVIPVGPAGRQRLTAIDRLGNRFESTDLGAVSFVPLISDRAQ